MSAWPQLSVAAWLLFSTFAGIRLAARPPRFIIALDRRAQRISGAVLTTAAIGEASLLWAGGFFDGRFF